MGCCKTRSSGGSLPPITMQAVNLTLTIANVIAYAIRHGKVGASTPVIQKRVGECQACRHLVQTRCSICGCYIEQKASLIAEKCPAGKW